MAPYDSTPAVDLLKRAIALRATDIHIDPGDDTAEMRFRIDGQLEHQCQLSHAVAARLVSQLKVMANLDIAEPFHPQEGRCGMPPELAEHEVRMTCSPVAGGIAVALRILHHRQLLRPLSSLGLLDDALMQVEGLLKAGEGIVLITGPTGAGKTTTAYSVLHALDDGHRSIATIEDPVEYMIPRFVQMGVDRQHDRTMAKGLKTLLRMDPDVVMLGEIRDAETAEAAMRAASSGKYVFSTFHTRDVASTVTALRDLRVDSRSLAGNLRGLISQRLVRRLCQACCCRRPLMEQEKKYFKMFDLDVNFEIAEPVGCNRCRQTGYYDRIGIFEVAVNSPTISNAIEHGATEDEIRDLQHSTASCGLAVDALRKVALGITSLDEAQSMTWVSFASSSAE